jgi:hypothetical protein
LIITGTHYIKVSTRDYLTLSFFLV